MGYMIPFMQSTKKAGKMNLDLEDRILVAFGWGEDSDWKKTGMRFLGDW